MLKWLWKRAREGGAAILDQGFVAGTSFLTTILVGRTVPADAFGVFALGFAGLVLAERLQHGLIGTPLLSSPSRGEPERLREYVRSALRLQGVVTGALIVSVLAGGLALETVVDWPAVLPVTLGLAAAVAPFQLRDLGRYVLYLQGRAVEAATVNGVYAAVQLGLLVTLMMTGTLTSGRAFLAIAASGTAALALAAWFTRESWIGGTARREIRHAFWRSGRWMGLSNLLLWAAMQAFLFVAAALLGPSQAGGFRAAQSVLGPTQFVTAGLFNVLTPRASRDVGEGRGPWPAVGLFALSAVVTVGAYAGLAFAVPEMLLALLFGPRYVEYGSAVQAMAVGYVLSALAAGMMMGLVARNRTDRVLVAHVATVAVTALVVYPLVGTYGVVGGAVGLSMMFLTRLVALGAQLKRTNGTGARDGSGPNRTSG